jgi:tRNA (guanine-N7-)-methyltransferase
VGKDKLKRFAETATFKNFIQPASQFYHTGDHALKGKWGTDFFHNDHQLYLELGCGKGEYTVGLANRYPGNNYLGVDIKGARMWRGAKTAIDNNIDNVGFLRTHIAQSGQFFGKDEVSGIWITFPDPQPQKPRTNKRLTSQPFLERYSKFLRKDAIIHLKTDNAPLFDYTLEVIAQYGYKLLYNTHDLYNTDLDNEAKEIQTFYESMFLAEGKSICYLNFTL